MDRVIKYILGGDAPYDDRKVGPRYEPKGDWWVSTAWIADEQVYETAIGLEDTECHVV